MPSETRTFPGSAWRLFPGREKSSPAFSVMLTHLHAFVDLGKHQTSAKWLIIKRKSIKQIASFYGRGMARFLLVEDQGTNCLAFACPSSSSKELGCMLAAGSKAALDRLLTHCSCFDKGTLIHTNYHLFKWNSFLLIESPLRERVMWEETLKVNGLPLPWHLVHLVLLCSRHDWASPLVSMRGGVASTCTSLHPSV